MAEQEGLPFDEREELRKEEARWWIAHSREVLAAGGRRYIARQPCKTCETTDAVLYPRGGQNTVLCSECGRLLYNAPKTETGEAPRTVKTLRTQMKPSQQARILDRDHARCVLCGRGDLALTIGHLLSIEDGSKVGATAMELNDDLNLAAMCEACNLGLNGSSVSPATYARIMLHLIRANAKDATYDTTSDLSSEDASKAQRAVEDAVIEVTAGSGNQH